jgi:hypothetical protein
MSALSARFHGGGQELMVVEEREREREREVLLTITK